jgi:hypothetical protein
MANKEHLKILEQGVDFWNQWRKNNPKIIPDLSRSLLHKENLSDAYLAETNLIGSNLSDAIFKGTNCQRQLDFPIPVASDKNLTRNHRYWEW